MSDSVIFGQNPQDQSNQQTIASSVSPGETPPVQQSPQPLQPSQSVQQEVPPSGDPALANSDPVKPFSGVASQGKKGDKSLLLKLIIGVISVIGVVSLILFLLPKGNSSAKVKLVWWGLWEDSRVVASLISDFEKKNPNITVEYVKQNPEQYRQRLIARSNNDTGPDIFRFHNTWYPMFSSLLAPLSSDVITPAEFKKDYYPVMQSDLVHDGAIYGIPLGTDSLSLFVNTKLFEAKGIDPPKNWDEFVTAAKELTVKDKNGTIKTSGAALGLARNVNHAVDILSLLFAQQGVTMQTFTATSEQKEAALTFYSSFVRGSNATWSSTLDNSLLAFSRGTLAMYFGYSWDIFAIQKINDKLSFAIHPVPSLYGKRQTIASYWIEGVSNKSKHQKEAMLFMHYLAQKETEQKFYTEATKVRSFGEPYARVDLATTVKDNPMIAPFITQMTTATSSFFVSDTHDGEEGINYILNNYVSNAITSMAEDNNSAQSAVETLDKGVSQVFTQYGIR
jgi:multiple sugar transport system substrate-binding protein